MDIKLATRLNKIDASPTLAITALANQLKADGKDVIGFGAGEPDFDTPLHIKQAAIEGLNEGLTKYSPVAGYPWLREAIVDKLKRDNSLSYSINDIIVSNGGKQVLYNLLMSLLNEGDEVIIPAPYWVSYTDLVKISDGVPKFVHTTAQSQFKMTPEQLDGAITKRTKAIFMNSPSNPTGAMYTKEELQALAKVLEKHEQVVIITDDIYEKLNYDNLVFYNLAMLSEKLSNRIVVVNGLSKAYSMTGWRIGYAATSIPGLIKAMSKLQGQSTSGVNSFAQKGAMVALNSSQECIETMKVEFVKRRDFIVDALNDCKGLSVSTPGGAFYVFPDITDLVSFGGFQDLRKKHPDEKDAGKIVSSELLKKYLVAVVPGIAFGYEFGFRMSYATSMENIKNGMDRIKKFTDSL